MGATGSTAFADRPEQAYAAKDMRIPDYTVEEVDVIARPPAVLTTRDLTLFSVLTILPATTITNLLFAGPMVFIYLVSGFLFFVLPRSVIVHWISTHFRTNETLYHMILQARGRTEAFYAVFSIWWPGVLLAIYSMKEILDLSHTFFVAAHNSVVSLLVLPGLSMLLVFGVAMLVACIPMRYLRNILFVLILPYLSIFLLLGILGLWWIASGHHTFLTSPQAWLHGIHSISMNDATLNPIVFSQLGIIVPLFLNGELRSRMHTTMMEGQRGRSRSFLEWSSLLALVLLISGTFGVMAIVPPQAAGTSSAVLAAIDIALGPVAASIVTNIFALGQLVTIVVMLLLYSRLMLVLAQEKRMPQRLACLNHHGVPVKSIQLQTILTAGLAFLFFVINPYLLSLVPIQVTNVLHIDSNFPMDIYSVVLTAASILFIMSSAVLFVGAIQKLQHQRRKQDKMAHVMIIFLMGIALLGLVSSLACTLLALTHPRVTYFSSLSWTLVIVLVIACFILLGWFISTLPRIQAALEEQRMVNARESHLRAQLEESYEQQKTLLEEVAQLYHEHAQAAITDAITGLPNHRAVMSTFDDVLDQSRRERYSCAVLFIDLDHFKHVNDTWGHRAGDAILHEVAQRLRDTLRTDDFVGRYGGEEFAILLRETDIDEAIRVGERLRVAISTTPCLYQAEDEQDAITIPLTTSIGVAVYQLHGTTRESLITSADNAMYRAKRTGRNRVCLADVELDAASMTPSQQVKTYTALETVQATQAIHALTAAASARDGETNEHAHRMVELAEATARRLACDGEEIRLIRLAALLHDIGKIGIPDAILHKPGPLTGDEWNVMRSHPEIGRTILERTGGVLRSLANVVAAHHERWDGSGYPFGLAGEDIPLGARILSVVDSYDAMTSRRTYREPRPIDEARVELQRCSGSQFDPCVVAAFLAALDAQGQAVDVQETSTRNEFYADEENMDTVSV